ncbi:hypothetical protein LOC71_08205 [Rhodopirellula sp. JC740]|uniref:Major facilitator superfamily (MFS) profile domain-containing protein n=1 Tax=Rhodopirellula halodulae TaxID=2894198 RepID=A0ABS8NFC5_9BACT|nr:hypothetical protein [Rhodopirellula sp. JC740]MCC9642254.1 hypothetical protein [Rhodopirellula sp. JC740]
MNAEPPIARFQLEHQLRRPGYAKRYRTEIADRMTNPYKLVPTQSIANSEFRSLTEPALQISTAVAVTFLSICCVVSFVSMIFTVIVSETLRKQIPPSACLIALAASTVSSIAGTYLSRRTTVCLAVNVTCLAVSILFIALLFMMAWLASGFTGPG